MNLISKQKPAEGMEWDGTLEKSNNLLGWANSKGYQFSSLNLSMQGSNTQTWRITGTYVRQASQKRPAGAPINFGWDKGILVIRDDTTNVEWFANEEQLASSYDTQE